MSVLSFLFSVLILGSVTGAAVFRQDVEKEIVAMIDASMKCHHIPGMTLSVVKGMCIYFNKCMKTIQQSLSPTTKMDVSPPAPIVRADKHETAKYEYTQIQAGGQLSNVCKTIIRRKCFDETGPWSLMR